MSNSMLVLPAPRRFALNASRQLERWALKPQHDESLRREAEAYERAVAAREQRALDALALSMLR
ncbi:hypothetical protein [Agrococcus sp. HG114]|uniref:hypothetical protein n=1 Tax=Agrococcus sp. HG114 TaxID=2969757 RepID=UPI00215A4224|nr:hypothetical protein [Agrococcus sp. HG114]MCR8669618.1 hypothetical protein [Agrococcus sp. HG114]